MKKYLLMVPLMIFPYAYLLFFIYMTYTSDAVYRLWGYTSTSDIWFGIALVYLIYVIFIVFYNTIISGRGKYTAYESAKVNLFVKGIQIPAYIFHFVLGSMGICMGIWGLGFIIVSVIVDLGTILLTGISSIGCTIRMKKEKVLHTPAAIFMGIGCFLYVVDVVIAVVYFFMARKRNRRPEIQAVPAEAIG